MGLFGAAFALLSTCTQPRAIDPLAQRLRGLSVPIAVTTAGAASCAILGALAGELKEQFQPVVPGPRENARPAPGGKCPGTALGQRGQAEPVDAASGRPRKILFVSNRAGREQYDIFAMEPDGSRPVNLTRSKETELDPVWSPDGRQIAFSLATDLEKLQAEIGVMNADGSGRRQLTRLGGWAFAPAWSPDGRRIAFSNCLCEDGDEKPALYVIDADGQNLKPLAQGMMPAWSPDGKKLLFTAEDAVKSRDGEEAVTRLCVVDADGRNRRRLIERSAGMGVWSPDGRRIAYWDEQAGLMVMNADGSRPTRLARSQEGELFGPHWSPDGRRIYFTRLHGGGLDGAEIYVVDVDGKNMRRLTNNHASDLLSGAGFLVPVAAALAALTWGGS